MRRTLPIALLLCLLPSCEGIGTPNKPAPPRADSDDTRQLTGSLTWKSERQERTISVAKLVKDGRGETIESDDPYYKKIKRYRALALAPLIRKEFSSSDESLSKRTFLLQASDGYAVRVSGEKLLHPAVYLAYADADHKSFQAIGERSQDPGPLYVVWKGSKFRNEKDYPRPWSLVKIELLPNDSDYKHTRPPGGFGKNVLAESGGLLFEKACLRCHSINQEGGTLGPDLNVPQNILAYRPEDQVRAYIKSPRTFRYSSMPDHSHLSERQLDSLVAYLRLMGKHRYDPQKSTRAP